VIHGAEGPEGMVEIKVSGDDTGLGTQDGEGEQGDESRRVRWIIDIDDEKAVICVLNF